MPMAGIEPRATSERAPMTTTADYVAQIKAARRHIARLQREVADLRAQLGPQLDPPMPEHNQHDRTTTSTGAPR